MASALGKTLAAFFAMALYFGVQSLAAMQALVRFQIPRQSILIAIAVYFACIIISAMLARRFHRHLSQGKSRYWFTVVLLLFMVPAIIQLFAHQVFGQWWQAMVMPALMGFYLPAAFYLFYQYIPLRHRGLLFALAMAVAEFNWLILLPIINSNIANMHEMLAHINNLQIMMQIALGLLLAVGYVSLAPMPAKLNGRNSASGRQSNLLILGMAVCLYLLYGLATSVGFPKLAPTLSIPLHFSFLLVLPLAGLLFDHRGVQGTKLILWLIAAIMLLSVLATAIFGQPVKDISYIAMAALRHGFLLLSLMLVVYLNNSSFLFWFCMLYLAQALSMFSAALGRNFVQPGWQLVLILLLLAGFALQLKKWSSLSKNANEPVLDFVHSRPLLMPGDPAEQVKLFAVALNLAPKERVVLSGVLQGLSLETIGKQMERSVHTVRLHLRRMLKKTNTANREELVVFYQQWLKNNF